MDVHMNETEQLQAIKEWWKQYGTMALAIFVLALAGNFGWNYFKSRKQTNSEYASSLYTQMMSSYYQDNVKAFKTKADYLVSQFPDVPYANFANFALAKQAVKEGKYPEAIKQLDAVIEKDHTQRFKQIARIRKARILLAQDKAKAAFEILQQVDEPTFMALINEVRGDIFMVQGEPTKARVEYQAALKAMPGGSQNRAILQMKFEQLAGPENGIA